jgi:hypothetical protein
MIAASGSVKEVNADKLRAMLRIADVRTDEQWLAFFSHDGAAPKSGWLFTAPEALDRAARPLIPNP